MNIAVDFDGTLITAQQRQMTLLKAVAKRYDVEIDVSLAWSLKREGASTKDLLANVGVENAVAAQIAIDWMHDIETPYWLSLDTLFADSISALEGLAAKDVALTLLTARQNEYLLRNQIRQLKLAKYFREIVCVSPFSAETGKSNVLKEGPFAGIVGDSETDLNAAKRANVKFWGVSMGQRSANFLRTRGAEVVFETLGKFEKEFCNILPR